MIHRRKLAESFTYAFWGVKHALKYNQNLRIHFMAALLVIFLSIFFKINGFEMGILGITILVVVVSEMLNTAIEEMVDLITDKYHQQAKVAKDVAAGMVLLTSIGSIIIGVLVFTPHIIRLFK